MQSFKINILIRLVVLAVVSWISIHIMAFLGIFISLAYSLWWLFSPTKIDCFVCRIRGSKNCHFSHAIADTFLLLVFSILSIGLVYGENKVLFATGLTQSSKTASFILPAKGQYRLGEVIPMKIEVSGLKVPVNSVQTDLKFDPERLEVLEISTKDSFANIFIQKEIDNETGYIRLTGGLPNPGYSSDRGLFGTVFFKGKSPGVVKIEFLPSSMVLANDGKGTNVLKDLASMSYLILPEKISPEEEKQESAILSSNVLGTTSENTQLVFYDDKQVLGSKLGQEIGKETKIDILKVILNFLEKFDQFILSKWSIIFSGLKNWL